MPRIRLIHPDAPKDEAVATLSPLARVTWAYLPCHADRAGRLEDKPFKLKLDILPLDSVNMNDVLAELEAGHLIHRYVAAGGRRCIQIRSFHRYQKPHKNEGESLIQPPEDATPAPQVLEQSGQVANTPECSDQMPAARAVSDPDPDPVSDPVSEITPTAGARDPSSMWPAAPAPAPAPAGRPWTVQRLLDLFARLRGELHPNTLPWHTPTGKSREKADVFLASLLLANEPGALEDIEPTMRRFLQHVRDSQDERDRDPSWLFSCWIGKFTTLREQHRGMSRAAGAPKDKPCEFHEGGRNQGRPERKAFQKATCAECRHLQARASPRPESEPSSIGDLVANVMPGR